MWLIKYSVIIVLLVFAAVKLQAYLRQAEHFRVETVEVRGAFFLGEQEIKKESGFKSSGNLFDFKPRQAEERLSANPWVKNVRARRLVPDRIVISVEERQPVALVAGQGLYCLAADGKLLPLRDKAVRLGLPVIRGLDVGAAELGQVVGSYALNNLLEHISGGEGPFRLRDFSEIRIASSGYELITLDMLFVQTGMELKESMALLRRVLDDAAHRGIDYSTADTRVAGQVILN